MGTTNRFIDVAIKSLLSDVDKIEESIILILQHKGIKAKYFEKSFTR